jgi:3-oxoacyl-[acyl-carrier-protein] synthase-3
VAPVLLGRGEHLFHGFDLRELGYSCTERAASEKAIVPAPASSVPQPCPWFIAHQANQRINEAVADKLKLPIEKFPSNIDRFGNTSAATIPILMDEMRRDGRLKEGQLVCLMALGAGFHWGSVLIRA